MAGAPDRAAHLVEDLWPWVLGVLAGLAVIGSALAPGALLNLDLVVTARVPFPESLLGLGPELPRRGPFYVLISAASWAGGGATAWKLLAVAAVATAFAGVVRRTDQLTVPARVGAGWVYALSPFLLTRLGVGHLGLVLAMALVPHALPVLARPGRHLGKTFAWSVGLSVCGVYGALLAVPLLVGGLVGSPARTWARVLAVFTAGQTWWLVSSAFVLAQGTSVAGGASFPPSSYGPGGYVRILAGHGFWQPAYQVGILSGWAVPVIGVVLTALASYGHRQLDGAYRRALGVGAAVGLVAAIAPVTPVLDALHEWFTTDTPLGGPVRESQRLLALTVLWTAIASALGLRRLSAQLGPGVVALPGLAALLLAAPGLWGIGGQLEPYDLPKEWAEARDAIDDRPGTVLALPWTEFFDLPVADGRRVVHPLPYHLGGDVIAAADPKIDPDERRRIDESIDPRTPAADAVVGRLRAGADIGDGLTDLGVRWIVLVVAADEGRYEALDSDPSLWLVVDGPTLRAYEHTGWRSDGVDHVLPFVARAGDSDPGRWSRPGGTWWLQGTETVGTDRFGLATLPGGSSVLWFWPAAVVLAGDLVVLVALVMVLRRLRGSARREEPCQRR